ncbi:hypothetical protein NHL50_02505 [Acidimicrobiia bacterium EGI L10123]|uniref:hypothetical protein n=1 Tax=Salinilacustrithrix flava TaxID=2957203 RepID=UPI003D7C2DDF|nr:hypothetical protein [Acidimicrobiia bacterium EGI L10123]
MHNLRFHRSRSAAAALVAASMLLAACGDDDDAVAATDDADLVEDAAASGDDADEGAEGGDAAPAEPGGSGYIELGDVRHELTVTSCLEMFGALGGVAEGTEDPENIEVTFDFPPEDWQERDASEGWETAGGVTVRSEEPYQQWETGQDNIFGFNLPDGVDASELDVTAIDIDADAQTVSGEAIFIDLMAVMAGDAEPVAGSFAFSCPAD